MILPQSSFHVPTYPSLCRALIVSPFVPGAGKSGILQRVSTPLCRFLSLRVLRLEPSDSTLTLNTCHSHLRTHAFHLFVTSLPFRSSRRVVPPARVLPLGTLPGFCYLLFLAHQPCTPSAPPSTDYTYSPVGPFHRLRPSSDAAPPIGDIGGTLPTPTFKARCDDTYSNKSWYFAAHRDAFFFFFLGGGRPASGLFFAESSTRVGPT